MNVTADDDLKNFLSSRNISIALGLLLAIAYLGPAIGTESFFYRDFGALGYPTAAYHREMFSRGELPLWNPYSNCGVPFLAQWGTMVLYPFTLIYCLLPLPWSLNFFCLLHLWWGAIGAMRLASRWTDSRPAAAVAGVLFLFNGITLGSLSWPNYTVALAWMPWIILFLEFNSRSVTLAALAGAMQMLAGAPEITLLTWMLAGILWLSAPTIPKLGRLALIVLLIAGLSAAQLFPFFELFSLSQRPAGVDIAKWALPATALANFLLPMLHAFQTSQGTWFQFDQHFLSSTYLGGAAILLAALGAIYGDRKARLLAIMTVLCVLCAMGGPWQKLPFLGLARYPVKFVFLLPLTVSLLAATGIQILEQKKICGKTFLSAASALFAFSIALILWTHAHPLPYDFWPATYSNSVARLAFFVAEAAAILLWMRTRRVELLLLLITALFLDGRYHLQNQNPAIAIKEMRAPIGSRPLPKLGEGRVFISTEAEKALLTSKVRDLTNDFIGKQLAVWSHLNLVELAPKVNGSATLQIREQKEFQDLLYSGTNSNFEAALDSLGVTQITAPGSVVEFTNRSTALPLVRIATNHVGKISGVKFRENEITFSLEAPTNTAVIVAQTAYPAWTLSAKGPRETYEERRSVSGAFQAYDLPAGQWAVRIYYDDKWFKRGTTVSLFTIFGLLYFTIRSRKAGRARS